MKQLCMLVRSARAKKANLEVWHLYYFKEISAVKYVRHDESNIYTILLIN